MNPDAASGPVCRLDAGEVLEVAWGRIAWSASRQLGNSATMTFGRATIFAGQENPRHRHPNCDEVLHLLAGRIEHALGEEHFIMEAGDTISSPQGVWHQARVLGEEDAQMVICFSSADRITEIAD